MSFSLLDQRIEVDCSRFADSDWCHLEECNHVVRTIKYFDKDVRDVSLWTDFIQSFQFFHHSLRHACTIFEDDIAKELFTQHNILTSQYINIPEKPPIHRCHAKELLAFFKFRLTAMESVIAEIELYSQTSSPITQIREKSWDDQYDILNFYVSKVIYIILQ